jgi:hypothetical protein
MALLDAVHCYLFVGLFCICCELRELQIVRWDEKNNWGSHDDNKQTNKQTTTYTTVIIIRHLECWKGSNVGKCSSGASGQRSRCGGGKGHGGMLSVRHGDQTKRSFAHCHFGIVING